MLSSVQVQRHFLRITPERARLWTPSIVGFGVMTGGTLLFIGERIPRVRQDILQKIPIMGNYWATEEQ
ncbi:cytochrome b-c1 complex subunit 10 [Gigaspora rosea]|uniref:Cytochrome b-c1 complex subunit 10 n=1 Tax=Gigaspora rosea TaxID=44941 RepID=A0A397U1W7_9GLOM|nr:cytochrome b-c1 complex subunit 10 [Gigaspora rosea]CAG8547998.1 19321_t:CDS:2 [Gigaspora rosea]